jgi:O-antigen/teichoic acid export membrane protein
VSKKIATNHSQPENNRELSVPLADTKPLQQHTGAQRLLKRAPTSYLFNQAYSFWFLISSFLFTILITRELRPDQYGIYAVIQTTINTITYIVALGLEDATTTFIPRILAENGQAGAAKLARHIVGLRLLMLVVSIAIIAFGLPLLATGIALIPISGARDISAGLQNPILVTYNIPIILYVFGTGIGNTLTALCSAQLRTQIVLAIGGITQIILLIASFVLLSHGWGITGLLWLQALLALGNALAFVIWQFPFLFSPKTTYKTPMRAVLKLSISAWLTNLASGALLKQISVILLGIYLISYTNIGYFNLSFQLADAANVLLVGGFSGVGSSALSAAFVGQNHERLGQTWQSLIKVETVLAAPGLIFCLFNAGTLTQVLYGNKYAPVGSLLIIFIIFNLFVRILGTTVHQASLYVVGNSKMVVFSQWTGIVVVIGAGCVLIPMFGAAGALMADGLAKLTTGILLLIALLHYIPLAHRQNLLVFTLRFMVALAIAALPFLLWHPSNRILLGIAGCAFVLLCLGMLVWIKPFSKVDMDMLQEMNPRIAKYLHPFARQVAEKAA